MYWKMYWKKAVFWCTGKMYWNFFEISWEMYWITAVREKCTGIFWKREHVGPNVGFRGSTILKIKIFGCFAAIPLTSSPHCPQYYSSESYIIIFITY
jgi:hypothetical protein